MKLRLILALAIFGAILTSASSSQAAPQSDAESILILHPFRNSYWWDHTNLTVAVRAAPNVDPALLEAAHDAIDTWNNFLAVELDGLVTLTDVTGERDANKADIVLHYVP